MMRRFAVALLALGTTALAQEARFGIQGSINLPQGDLAKKEVLDHQLGFGLGIHGTFPLGRGHVLRPRVDYILYGGNDTIETGGFGGSTFTDKTSMKLKNLAFGLDYLYFIEGREQGFYVTGGLSHNAQKFEAESTFTASGPNGTISSSGSFDKTYNKIGFAAGFGYQVNKNFGAELRYTQTKFGEDDWTNNNIQVGATWRF